jgi:predicted nucleotide-binding protein
MISTMARSEKESLKILFVDDDAFLRRPYIDALRDEGYEVIEAAGVKSALAQAQTRDFDAVILDIMLPSGTFTSLETHGGFKTGIALARELRDRLPEARILALTMSTDPEVQAWFTSDDSVAYANKRDVPPSDIARQVMNLVEGTKSPRVFIVHGRDSHALSELKTFLSRKLRISDPIVLAEQKSKGKTLIEKFEHYARNVDVVFVLAMADDLGRLAKPGGLNKPRARQNVVFELGYFLGALKRSTGRVILLYERGIELPSDIAGVVYIDISSGVDSAEAEIRRELADWIG